MTKKRVIVADDDEDDRMLVQSAFEENKTNVHIDFARDGNHLLEILANGKADSTTLFILLDLNMPRKDGRQVLREIKENLLLRKIPVIVFTTAKNEAEIKRCYDLGANTYIVKPDSFAELQKVIASLSSYWLDTATVAS